MSAAPGLQGTTSPTRQASRRAGPGGLSLFRRRLCLVGGEARPRARAGHLRRQPDAFGHCVGRSRDRRPAASRARWCWKSRRRAFPCSTLARRMDDSGFVKSFRDAERPGAYCRVMAEGEVAAEMPVTLSALCGRSARHRGDVSQLVRAEEARASGDPEGARRTDWRYAPGAIGRSFLRRYRPDSGRGRRSQTGRCRRASVPLRSRHGIGGEEHGKRR